MTRSASTTTDAPPASITRRNKIGICLAAALGLLDLSGLASLNRPEVPGQQGPPDVVLIACAVLGAVTIAAVVLAWRRHSRGGLRVAAAALLLSSATSLPAFFVEGVPAPLVVLVAVGLVITLITVALLVSRR